jgi:hypothetical protein
MQSGTCIDDLRIGDVESPGSMLCESARSRSRVNRAMNLDFSEPCMGEESVESLAMILGRLLAARGIGRSSHSNRQSTDSGCGDPSPRTRTQRGRESGLN